MENFHKNVINRVYEKPSHMKSAKFKILHLSNMNRLKYSNNIFLGLGVWKCSCQFQCWCFNYQILQTGNVQNKDTIHQCSHYYLSIFTSSILPPFFVQELVLYWCCAWYQHNLNQTWGRYQNTLNHKFHNVVCSMHAYKLVQHYAHTYTRKLY